jgi:hypothetical protein
MASTCRVVMSATMTASVAVPKVRVCVLRE